MRKLGGIVVVGALALAGCAAPVERASNVQPAVSVQDDMLAELRPLLKTLKSDDDDLMDEARGACAKLLTRDKDSYREALLDKYDNLTRGLDHLTVAAAAKKYLCP